MSKTKTIAACAITALAVTTTSATAATLITSAKIKDGTIMNRDIHRGTISENRLDRGVVAKLNRLAVPGKNGANGANGTNGTQGARGATGPAGANGTNGANGQNGQDGRDGVNPATVVAKSGDAGWSFSGSPAAKLTGGELRLAGGFDANTAAGGIGIAKAYDVSLSSLSALSYDVIVHARPNDLSAPAIHVTLTGAARADGAASGFTNLVFEPYQNGGTAVGERKAFDAYNGQWWSTKDLTGHPRQATASLASFITDNPSAKIVGISIDNGNTSGPGTIPVDALSMGADNLVVGFGDQFDRYDFGG